MRGDDARSDANEAVNSKIQPSTDCEDRRCVQVIEIVPLQNNDCIISDIPMTSTSRRRRLAKARFTNPRRLAFRQAMIGSTGGSEMTHRLCLGPASCPAPASIVVEAHGSPAPW